MLVEDLIHRFVLVKKRNPLHANELLDYIQKSYIYGELSIVEYKKLFFELDKQEAKKPSSFFVKIGSFDFEKYKLSSTI
ncbi:YppF family protein [Metabacillus rhizolycopersici]|uniref:YppF family protein n=1 Tax=Metabacillus rhizolycopersici TaxID=2875709 RepID=A0ABS7V039_9BACI|nr:YppF family protein [Metabacillus rhizolycopersici]MBZ5753657.1 YppF family protein [Metabacillus rhizolycopersici]